MIRKMRRDVSELKKEVVSLRPNRSAGVLTSVTTRGVFRRTISDLNSNSTTNNSSVKARWA
jgi:hypothetical protein